MAQNIIFQGTCATKACEPLSAFLSLPSDVSGGYEVSFSLPVVVMSFVDLSCCFGLWFDSICSPAGIELCTIKKKTQRKFDDCLLLKKKTSSYYVSNVTQTFPERPTCSPEGQLVTTLSVLFNLCIICEAVESTGF